MRIRARRRSPAGRAITTAFIGGVVAGIVVWSMQIRRSRRDLFSPNALRRLAALGYLRGHPGIESAQILSEYVRWEKKPILRKRAERILGRMQRHLV